MKRDVAIVPFQDHFEIVIATDNSGSIGMKQADDVTVPYETVGYYSFRVAYMECVAAKAIPFSVTIHNFCGDDAWSPLVYGVKKGLKELHLESLAITGSTETNFTLMQSAVSITVLGRRINILEQPLRYRDSIEVAVIGKPLVGEEVIEQKENVAPLELFQTFAERDTVTTIMPIGSKGILYELNELFSEETLRFATDLNMEKSSGPSTSFIIVYSIGDREEMERLASNLFHPVEIEKS